MPGRQGTSAHLSHGPVCGQHASSCVLVAWRAIFPGGQHPFEDFSSRFGGQHTCGLVDPMLPHFSPGSQQRPPQHGTSRSQHRSFPHTFVPVGHFRHFPLTQRLPGPQQRPSQQAALCRQHVTVLRPSQGFERALQHSSRSAFAHEPPTGQQIDPHATAPRGQQSPVVESAQTFPGSQQFGPHGS
jgi:hypothetical protein